MHLRSYHENLNTFRPKASILSLCFVERGPYTTCTTEEHT